MVADNQSKDRPDFLFRAYLSLSLNRSAYRLSGAAEYAETHPAEDAQSPEQRAADCLPFVMGSVLCSVAFLEARINELLSDLAEEPPTAPWLPPVEKHSAFAINRIVELGLLQKARLPTLEKYELVLSTLGAPAFEKDQSPYQDVRLLILLRNAIVHFEPEWLTASQSTLPQADQHRLERALHGRFSLSPFVPEIVPFFPRRCLSAGCARWAADSVSLFTKAFAEKIGLDLLLPAASARRL